MYVDRAVSKLSETNKREIACDSLYLQLLLVVFVNVRGTEKLR